MAVRFKASKRGQPGVAGGGDPRYYATVVNEGEWTIDDLTKIVERTCTVNGADIRAVTYSLVDAIGLGLENGKIVHIGDLGTVRLTISSEGKDTPEEVTADCIKKSGTIFTPGKRIKKVLDALTWHKA